MFSDRTALETALAGLIPLGEDGVLVGYGNPDGLDVDLLAVAPGSLDRSWKLGQVDLLVLNKEECEKLILFLDPTVTEPVQTGRLIAGSESYWQHLQLLMRNARPNRAATAHLLRRGLEETLSARAWLNQYRSSRSCRDAEISLLNLSYGFTYVLRARSFLNGGGPAPLAEFQEHSPLLRRILRLLHQAKHGEPPSSEALEATLEDWEILLANGSPESLA